MTAEFVKKNSGSENDAQDLFQEAMVVLFEKTQSTDFQLTSSLKTYLYAICRNKWLMVLRSRKNRSTTLIDTEQMNIPSDESIQRDIDYQERNELMRLYFKKIGADCQQVLSLFMAGTSLREIANKMGFTEGYAKKRKFTCQKKLIELIISDPRYQELRVS